MTNFQDDPNTEYILYNFNKRFAPCNYVTGLKLKEAKLDVEEYPATMLKLDKHVQYSDAYRAINNFNLRTKKTKVIVNIHSLNKAIVIEEGFFNKVITAVKIIINKLNK